MRKRILGSVCILVGLSMCLGAWAADGKVLYSNDFEGDDALKSVQHGKLAEGRQGKGAEMTTEGYYASMTVNLGDAAPYSETLVVELDYKTTGEGASLGVQLRTKDKKVLLWSGKHNPEWQTLRIPVKRFRQIGDNKTPVASGEALTSLVIYGRGKSKDVKAEHSLFIDNVRVIAE